MRSMYAPKMIVTDTDDSANEVNVPHVSMYGVNPIEVEVVSCIQDGMAELILGQKKDRVFLETINEMHQANWHHAINALNGMQLKIESFDGMIRDIDERVGAKLVELEIKSRILDGLQEYDKKFTQKVKGKVSRKASRKACRKVNKNGTK